MLAAGRVLPPVSEEPGTRLLVSGTGLTHLGSVQQRDAMHKAAEPAGPISDSRKMFEMGLAGGRPAPGQRGAAPEWFYKGDGRILRGPGQALDIPGFAPDGGEEPEYNAVDAALWMVVAVGRYLEATADAGFVRMRMADAVASILAGYRDGTRHGIRMDDDGLIVQGEEGLQLTWMDARIGTECVTPRRGRAVIPFETIAPSRWTSKSRAYSVP